jgi:hypothetical protein
MPLGLIVVYILMFVLTQIGVELELRDMRKIKENKPMLKNEHPVSIAKCALDDIEGLLNELDDNVLDTERDGVKDTVRELIGLIAKTDKEWLNESYPGWEQLS